MPRRRTKKTPQTVGKANNSEGRGTIMTHIKTINKANLKESACKGGCGECQTSCQSACKTSCTVANQKCEQLAPKAR